MSRNPAITIAAEAEEDMCAIWSYIALDNPAAADRLWQRLMNIYEMLSRQPLIGESCAELAPSLRSFPAGNYVVYYRPAAAGIQIVRVIHSARDTSSLF